MLGSPPQKTICQQRLISRTPAVLGSIISVSHNDRGALPGSFFNTHSTYIPEEKRIDLARASDKL